MRLVRLKRRIFSHYLFVRLTILALVITLGLVIFGSFVSPLFNLGRSVFPALVPQNTRISETDGRTNILLLGIGGGDHDGPDLTDSIAVISLKSTLKEGDPFVAPVLVSLPRDIYLDELADKINGAYDQGEKKRPGGGLFLSKSVVSKVTGLPLHYAIVIDFTAFEKIIDLLGGIDVTVERSFDDYKFPVKGKENETCNADPELLCRYTHLHFDAGATHFDGSTALKFVRSRQAENEEGSDFARAKRQQLVLQAVKNKVFSLDTLLNPQKISDIYQTLRSHINTDINDGEFNAFLKLGLKYKNAPVKSLVITEDFFNNPPLDERGWILLPKDGDFTQIHQFLDHEIN